MTSEEYNREYRSFANARDLAVKVNDKKLAKYYRQQISSLYEAHGKDLKETPVEQAELDRLDAQRYRKQRANDMEILQRFASVEEYDAAVDALPEPGQKGGE
jgi:hypothetical protein